MYTDMCVYIDTYIYIYICLTLKHFPSQRKQCCKRRMESLVCRCALSYQGITLRVRVPFRFVRVILAQGPC